MRSVRKPWWQQATALVTVSTGGVITGFNFVPGAAATMTSPTSVPLHLFALEKAAQPGTFTDLAVGDSAARVTSDAQLRAAIVNVAGYYLRLAATRTPAQMEALIWDKTSSDGTDHGPSCAAFASLTLELAAQAVGQQSWVTGGSTYPWPLPEWADARVDTNPVSPGVTSMVADAQAHGRWHPLGDGYQPQPGDWAVYNGHAEVVTSYADGVLDTIGADSLPELTVNAHSSAAPLAEQGVAGFVDNGNLKPTGTVGTPASAAPATASPGGDQSPAPTPTPTGATATIPGIPATGALAGTSGSAGTSSSAGTGGSAGTGVVPDVRGTAAGAGTASGARIPGVLATGDLLGQPAAGTAAGPHPGSGHEGSAAGTGADATIPGLPGSSPAAGAPAIPGTTSAGPAAAPTAAAPSTSPSARPTTPAASPTPTARASVAPANSAGPNYATPGTRNQQAFISLVAPGAIAAQQRYGVPASVTIAQAIEESAWGQSGLSAQYHNLFGIKGTGPAGSVSLPTSEYQGGLWVTIDAQFRVYHNDAESIADHAELLATSGYYTRAMADRAVPDAFANDLTGVYATDPDYGANLIALMKLYNLYQFDGTGTSAPTASPATTPSSSATPTTTPTLAPTASPTGHPATTPTPTPTESATPTATATPAPSASPTGYPATTPATSPAGGSAAPTAGSAATPTSRPAVTPTEQAGSGQHGQAGAGHAAVPGVAAPALAPVAPAMTSTPGMAANAATAGHIPGLLSPGPLTPTTAAQGQSTSARGTGARGTGARGTSARGGTVAGIPGNGGASPGAGATIVPGGTPTASTGGTSIPGLVAPGTAGRPGPAASGSPTPASTSAARGTSAAATAPARGGARIPGVASRTGIVTTARITRALPAKGAARYQPQLPPAVATALFATAKAPLARGEHLYRDVAACTGIGWELLAAVDWMQCKADPRYSPVLGEKLGSLNRDGTSYPTKSAALTQCACDLIELAAAVYGIDLTARRRLSVRELGSAFAAFRWGALLWRHGVSAMEFPYSVAGLTAAHQKMHWPSVDAPDAPDRPGARFREPFGAVPVVLSLDYPATV